MALYLVRWPDLSCTLVTARDEDHLVYLLDEVGNPVGCRWTEYDGPVFIDFHLPVRITIDWPEQAGRPLSPEAFQIEGLDLLAQRAGIQAEVGAGDTAGEMLETIMKFAFPATAEMYCDALEEVLEESQLRDALRADLMLLAESSWRRAHLERTARDDSVAKLAVEMDAPMELAKYWEAMVAEMHGGEHDEHGVVDGLDEDKADRMRIRPIGCFHPCSFSTSRPIGVRRFHCVVIPSSLFEMRRMPSLPTYSETVFSKTSTVVCRPLW